MLVRAATSADAKACVEIYRPYVLDTAITFETEVPTGEQMSARIEAARPTFEWLVLKADDADDAVIGYAYAHQLNPRAAYQWSVETSVYLAPGRVRSGGGRMLYAELLDRLANRGFRQAFAGITQPNDASNGFHTSFGFAPVGHYRRVGWKLGAWHDVQWWQRDLGADDGPPAPIQP
ncbi:GCN5 family acetyltransferase [Mycobacterium asiaticum]|uniref:GCN5 family acetyltransferase n=1 Tax=Mycobacterium asiaticum TaxID=1790 RepID=A0A1A3P8S7_MYCAS|nr:GNAT family N-acetyltransferase [Mycobacterium asiaticum]OBK30633.1 GCN5 family acetyltransferase [Mycobacterium asiaticum]